MSKRWIEAFRIGGKASRGIKPEHLAEVVDDDFGANPRALCFGHPKSDDPAAGTISGARLDGNSLMVEVASLTKKAIDGIRSGEWLNRSAAFFDPTHEANPRPGKWTLRHVGLLGAAAPGIPNMTPLSKALAFSADGDDLEHLEVTGDPADAVIFSGAPTPVHFVFESKEPDMTGTATPTPAAAPTDADLTARGTALDTRESEFSARVKRQFDATNGSAIDALVRGGQVLPAEADGLKLAFGAFDPEGEELTFGAGDKAVKTTAAAHILAFMAGLPKRVPLGERQSPATTFTAGDDGNGPKPSTMAGAAADAGALTAKADALVKANPGLTFEAAIEQVSAGGNVDAAA